jgi:ATP-dependent helicase/nuclease subunit B
MLLSRLLLQGSDRDTASTVLRFVGEQSSSKARKLEKSAFREAQTVSRPKMLKAVPVTGLELYKKCPYRFYLRYIERLEEPSERYTELDPLSFGTLAHELMEQILRWETIEGISFGEIKSRIREHVETLIEEHYGSQTFPAVPIQLKNLRARLFTFLHHHGKHRALGWQTIAVEQKVQDYLTVEGNNRTALPISGKIDRIDYNPAFKELRIYDYKFSELPISCNTYHMTNSEWVRFQLPAYAGLVKNLPIVQKLNVDATSLCLFNLPKSLAKMGESFATWDTEQLLDARLEIASLVSAISMGSFNRLSLDSLGYDWVCQPPSAELIDSNNQGLPNKGIC